MKVKNYIKEQLRLVLESSFDNQEMVDAILDKISQQGIQSLSPEEKQQLENPDYVSPEKSKDEIDREFIDMVMPDGENEEDLTMSDEEDQEDQVLMALSELKYRHGEHLETKEIRKIQDDGQEYRYLELWDDNGEHIMNLELRVYIQHNGEEEEVGMLSVDNKIWGRLFLTYGVNNENKINVFKKYIGEALGLEVMEAKPEKIQ